MREIQEVCDCECDECLGGDCDKCSCRCCDCEGCSCSDKYELGYD